MDELPTLAANTASDRREDCVVLDEVRLDHEGRGDACAADAFRVRIYSCVTNAAFVVTVVGAEPGGWISTSEYRLDDCSCAWTPTVDDPAHVGREYSWGARWTLEEGNDREIAVRGHGVTLRIESCGFIH